MSAIYTLESLSSMNTAFDISHGLTQLDVELVNQRVKLIEISRGDRPCPGDIIEHTNEWGEYSPNAHINEYNAYTGQLTIRIVPYTPFVFVDDGGQEVSFSADGGLKAYIEAAALTHIGKREKLFKVFGHGGVYFKASVNVWEYIAPNQQHPGYSTKHWAKRLISSTGKAYRSVECPSSGQEIIFDSIDVLQRWKDTYRAVGFPGYSHGQYVCFHYREKDVLLSREEWDALDLPIDTCVVNGVVHVKVAYDENAHKVTAYRFTNKGYLNPKQYGPYEKAKGALLFAPRVGCKKQKGDPAY